MDGLQGRLRHSIRWRLSLWLSVAILVMALAAGALSFAGAYNEAHETQDQVLRQVASLLRHQGSALLESADPADADPEARLVVQFLAPAGAHRNPPNALPLPNSLPDGLQTVALERASYRVLVASSSVGTRVAVAQETAVRDELAMASALRTVLPLLILVPILLLVVAYMVRQQLRPMARLARDIEARSESELHALAEHGLPTEIRPFVVAINRMLERVTRVLEAQRRFVADAAHELRSPLTALSLQAERLDAAELDPEARVRLSALRRGIERGRALLEQLLTFARVQSGDAADPASCDSVQALRRVLEDLLPLAEAKGIDVGIVTGGDDDTRVAIGETALRTVLKNLLENGIRYTPTGGKVDLSVVRTGRMAELVVEDTGPGIAPDERQRVLAPFYRTLGSSQSGSGLGLAIVKAVLDRHGAQLRFEYADMSTRSGLRVTVAIPLAQPAA